MFMFTETETQKTPDEIIADLKAQVADLEPKAASSSQNFERLKKEQDKVKDLETKLADKGETKDFDPTGLKKEVNEKVDLRLSGYTPEMIEEIESYAKGKGVSLSEAAKSPFIAKAVDALRAEAKAPENTPNPSNRSVSFNGKSAMDVLKDGSAAEKQGAFEALIKTKRG